MFFFQIGASSVKFRQNCQKIAKVNFLALFGLNLYEFWNKKRGKKIFLSKTIQFSGSNFWIWANSQISGSKNELCLMSKFWKLLQGVFIIWHWDSKHCNQGLLLSWIFQLNFLVRRHGVSRCLRALSWIFLLNFLVRRHGVSRCLRALSWIFLLNFLVRRHGVSRCLRGRVTLKTNQKLLKL